MAKSAKDQTVNPSPLSLLKDTTKLKKHIALLCDRLGKGAQLVIEGYKPVTCEKVMFQDKYCAKSKTI
jgi:Bardet-Biedl syndrome 9 protein